MILDVPVIAFRLCTGMDLLSLWKKCVNPGEDGSEWEKADRQELRHITGISAWSVNTENFTGRWRKHIAGIGFELKKLFSRRGLFASFRAYGYAGIICTGPMLLGIVLLLGVMFLCDRTGASKQSRELLVCMITYTLLASLTVTSFLSMVVTRFIADMLYEEKNEAVL